MSDGATAASASLAALDLGGIQASILFGLRVLLGLAGAFVGWLLTKPLVRVLFRLAFQRPIPPKALTTVRLLGAAALGALIFYLFPLGLGGGYGPGLGGGPGLGPGTGKEGKSGGEAGEIEGKKGEGKTPAGLEVLRVEMIPSKRYQHDDRFYLIEGKEPPVTLAEVDAYLDQRKGELRELHILVYANSVEAGHPTVQDLRKLADSKYHLGVRIPDEYRAKIKTP